ncbi:tetratricopeptide repeat protein [Sphingobacterium yanglingense]|uniref:TPR repeat protein n=1 Tax=Sphingobacterium yanglingense TaxID=1437280 RepID=A0A4R6WEZ6_9SPHI|nr:tetratricopeptide repeat protein [Sphingobacterium yanglingense]TDQ76603.1 TPR repeat protein [Sphingobacterium yanglingense]
MKKLLYTPILLFAFTFAQAQNDIKARLEFEEAEKAFSEENYETALKHLNETEKELGKWSPLVSYLKIESLYALTDMGNFGAPTMQPLYEEVTLYMTYLNKLKSDEVPMDKYKVVYGIEKTLKALKLEERQSADFLKAKKEYDAKNYDVAIPLYEELAQRGNSSAMHSLGIIYRIKKDNEKSKEWYLKAIDKGNAVATGAFAYVNTEEDIKREYFEKAAKLGHPYGFYELGWYANKDGNVTKTMEYYQQAADLGIAAGLYKIGEKYKDAKDYTKAFPYFKKAAIKGHYKAMESLGVLYFNGDGVEKNTQLGMEHLLKAANSGITNSMRIIGSVYHKQLGNYAKDYTKAAEWYQKMIDKGDESGYLNLGDLYSLEDNNQPQKALEYYEKVAEVYPEVTLKTANLYFSGKGGITKDYAKAIKYYEKYYDNKKKNESYIDNLIEMYSRGGNGIEKNKEKAKYWKEIRRK